MSRGGTHAKQQLVFDRIMKKKKKKKNEISYSNVQGEREREHKYAGEEGDYCGENLATCKNSKASLRANLTRYARVASWKEVHAHNRGEIANKPAN